MYTAENLDAKKLEEYLRDCEAFEGNRTLEKKKEADAYFEGYKKAIRITKDALHCSNYEKSN